MDKADDEIFDTAIRALHEGIDHDRAHATLLALALRRTDLAVKCWRAAADVGVDMEAVDKIRRFARTADPSPEFYIESELYLPMVPQTRNVLVDWWKRADAGLHHLEELELRVSQPERLLSTHMFGAFCVYHDAGALPLRARYAKLLTRACPELSPAPCLSVKNGARNRIRLGVLVATCHNEIFSALHAGFLERIDRRKFEVVLYRPEYDFYDRLREFIEPIDRAADQVFAYDRYDFRHLYRLLEGTAPDVLLHENWKSPLNFLGLPRFAPVQCSFLDCNQSMGTPNEDYALLCGCPEWLPSWRSQYNEKIACLCGWPYWPKLPGAEAESITCADLGIPESGRMLFSWQPVYRWRVEDDTIIEQLLRRNSELWFVIVEHPSGDSAAIRKRWRRVMPGVVDRIRFIPRQGRGRLSAIIALADVILAPPGGVGTLSTATSVCEKKPYVAYLESENASAVDGVWAYDLIGVEGLVAENHSDYVAIVQRLLDDDDWRKTKTREFQEKSPALHNVDSYVREFEEFIEMAYDRSMNGLSPMHWRQGVFVE